MKIEIINQQKREKVNPKALRAFLQEILTLLDAADKEISVLLCDNTFITTLNKQFFNKDGPTDVIAFPLSGDINPGYLGEVVVSVQEAVKASGRYHNHWKEELARYLVHGILHLMGHDDATADLRQRMARQERNVIRKCSRGAGSFLPVTVKEA